MLIKKLPLFFFCVFFQHYVNGQCNYNLPDTVCPLQNMAIASPGTITVDLCSSRFDSLVSIQNLPALLNGGTYQFKAIKENNRYFIFTNVYGSIYTYRYEFNPGFDAILSTASNIAQNDTCYGSFGFDMTKIDTLKWVAFKADNGTNNLFKITFDSIDDNNLDFQYVGNFGMSGPATLKIFGNYVFVTNNVNNAITKIHFDDGFQNVLDSAVITGSFSPLHRLILFMIASPLLISDLLQALIQ